MLMHARSEHARSDLSQRPPKCRQIGNAQLDFSFFAHFFYLARPAGAFRGRELPILYRTKTIHFARPPDLAVRTKQMDA
jgi:hypothetical protein